MKLILKTILVIFIFLSFGLKVNAGGPLVVDGGMAVTYGSMSFIYRYDQGSLGKFSNSEAVSIFSELYGDWEAVPTSTVMLMQDSPGFIDFDVNATNFKPILDTNDLLGYSPVVFDVDGSLTDALLGRGTSNTVLGFSGPRVSPGSSTIPESQAVFNGRFINGIDTPSDPESTIESFMGTVIHETGHGLGLDHSQINVDAIKPSASQELRDSVPLMFPVAVNDLFLIRRDDASAITLLYPDSTALKNYGSIEGKLFRQDGMTPVLGGNVIARNINNPLLEAVSCVSDYLSDNTGSYKLPAVPPGDYRIEIEPIDIKFTGGSGVGPYTLSKSDKSFQNPVPKGFYTGPNKPISTSEGDALIVTVTAGQAIRDANIIGSQSSSTTTSSSSSSGSGFNEVNEAEPNDTVQQAQLITLPVTVIGHASQTDFGDIELTSEDNSMLTIHDLYKFTLTEKNVLNGHLINESTVSSDDLDLILFNEDASQVIDSSTQGENSEELINKLLEPGTYILGVSAFSGSADYRLEVSNLGAPSVVLSGSERVLLNGLGATSFQITLDAFNFTEKTKCKVISSDPTLIKRITKKFYISPFMTSKTLNLKVPPKKGLELISGGSETTVTVSVLCKNGAVDEKDVVLAPQ